MVMGGVVGSGKGGLGFDGLHSEPKILNIIGLYMEIFWFMLKTLSGPLEPSPTAFSCLSSIHFCSGPLNRYPSSQWFQILPRSPRHWKYDFRSFGSATL